MPDNEEKRVKEAVDAALFKENVQNNIKLILENLESINTDKGHLVKSIKDLDKAVADAFEKQEEDFDTKLEKIKKDHKIYRVGEDGKGGIEGKVLELGKKLTKLDIKIKVWGGIGGALLVVLNIILAIWKIMS